MSAAPDLLAVARRIPSPTLIPPGFGGPEHYARPEDVADRLLELSKGKAVTLYQGQAAYPDFDPFPCLRAYAGPDYVATVSDRWDSAFETNAGRQRLEGLLADRTPRHPPAGSGAR